jgi:hypothetical protein
MSAASNRRRRRRLTRIAALTPVGLLATAVSAQAATLSHAAQVHSGSSQFVPVTVTTQTGSTGSSFSYVGILAAAAVIGIALIVVAARTRMSPVGSNS